MRARPSPALPRIEVDGRFYVLQEWVGLGRLVSAREVALVRRWVYEPTFRLDGDVVVLDDLEKSPNYGYLAADEAGEIGAPIPFSGRMLTSFTPTPQSESLRPTWLRLGLGTARDDIVLASDIQELVFSRGSLVERRSRTADFAELMQLLEQRSDRYSTTMAELVSRRPIRVREARELLSACREDAAAAYRGWAREAKIPDAYRLAPLAVHSAQRGAEKLAQEAQYRSWGSRPRARRDVDGPRLVEASRETLAKLGDAATDASHVAGTCPRCGQQRPLRVCLGEGFVLCDECWFVWW